MRKQAEAGRCLDAALATLAATASQAFYITERSAPPRLASFLEVVREAFPPLSRRRPVGADAEVLQGLLSKRVFAGRVTEK